MNLPARIVDVHTHLFNARYLPIEGIVGALLPRKLRYLATLLDLLLTTITGSSTREIREKAGESIRANPAQKDDILATAIWEVAKRELVYRAIAYASMASRLSPTGEWREFAADRLSNDSLFTILLMIEEEYEKQTGDVNPTNVFELFSRLTESDVPPSGVTNFEALEKQFDHLGKAVRWLLLKIAHEARHDWWDHADNLLEFFLTILESEKNIFVQLRDSYGTGAPERFYVHHLLDMKYGYKPPDEPYYGYLTQLSRMSALGAASEGMLFACAGFDPRRPDCMEVAERAIDLGFIGFKFYPPMGIRPANNDDLQIEAKLDEFFRFCIENDLPVFTHCTPGGFQASRGSGKNSHPIFWRARLEKQGFGKLRLCFGHAGGGRQRNGTLRSAGWFSKSENEWKDPNNFARIVNELCVKFENVFCEFSYMHEFLHDQAVASKFTANLECALECKFTYSFGDKIMYGSDWHMPNMIDENHAYLNFFLDLFQKEPFRQHCESFFWKNAFHFFKLPGLEPLIR